MKYLPALAALALAAPAFAQPPAAPDLAPTLSEADVDAENSAQFVGATASPAPNVAQALYFASKRPEWHGAAWGAGKVPGARRLRLAFKRPVDVGTVLVRGGGKLSVLKASAKFPGDPNDEAQWIAARRVSSKAAGDAPVARNDLAIWLLPPNTKTRALRFSHTPANSDTNFEAWLGAAMILPQRVANVAPWAQAQAARREEAAPKLNNESPDGWDYWSNGTEGAPQVLAPAAPERVSLVWPAKVSLRGIGLVEHGIEALQVQAYTGPDARHPREAREEDWKAIATRDNLRAPYPLSFGLDAIPFENEVSTRALRLVITKTSGEYHPHLNNTTRGGKRVWLGEILALSSVAGSVEQVLAPLQVTPKIEQPPIPITFSIPEDGLVTLVIEDASGRRVRNLISETPFKKGRHTIGWDATHDIDRDREAARHGAFRIPPRLVEPGKYSVRGLWHRPLGLTYEFSVYNAGNPAWETQDKTGGWLTNHTPPSAALFVPAAHSLDGSDTIFLGSFVSEGGAGLAWTDLNGRKKGGRGWIGGNWTAAAYLARDDGPSRLPNVALYAASPWSAEDDPNRAKTPRGEIRVTGLSKQGDLPILKHTFEPGGLVPNVPAGEGAWAAQMGGLAVRNGLIAISQPPLNRILFVDATLNRVRATATVQDPRGVAFDSSDRLLVTSGKQLLRFTLPASLRPVRFLDRATWKATASLRGEEAANALDADPNTRWDTRGGQKKGMEFALDMGVGQTFNSLRLHSTSTQDSPRALQVLASDDGTNWRELWRGEAPPEWKASGTSLISFAPTTARHLKLVLDKDSDDGWWSINDLQVLDAPAMLESVELGAGQVLDASLDEPQQIILAGDGRIFVSQWGASHNVQVLAPDGARVATVGKAGTPKPGPYDPTRMNRPKGMSIDSNGRLWVAEEDFQPKRVSVWQVAPDAPAKLWKAMYGPSRYGGGGTLDGRDPSKLYYDGMEFALDWKTGSDRITHVFHRPQPGELGAPDGYGSGGSPEFPIYFRGHKYFSNSFNSNPTNGAAITMLWKRDAQGIARPVAAAGRANDWSLLKTNAMRSRWPSGADLNGDYNKGDGTNRAAFVWADQNGDHQMQPAEVEMTRAETGGVVVHSDLSFLFARFDPDAKNELSDKSAAVRLAPTAVSASGVPSYDWSRRQVLAPGAQRPATSGGDQVLTDSGGWALSTIGLKPFAPESLSGARNGRVLWQYPSLWPGLHASHEAPQPAAPGQIIGTTRLLGLPISVATTPQASTSTPPGTKKSAVQPPQNEVLWFVNGNMGNMYVFTQDGLFVGQLFEDIRQGPNWAMPIATRGMKLNGVSLHDENFWPSVAQTPDGRVYVIDGGRSSLVRVSNLDSIRRLPAQPISITTADLSRAVAYTTRVEEERRKTQGTPTLRVPILANAPAVDGALTEWEGTTWASIDKSGVAANFNSDSKPFNIEGAVAVAEGKLFAAWKTNDVNWLRNSGEVALAPFKTGGALDLMIASDPNADPKRANPVAGDVRLLVTQIEGKTRALLYRAVVAGTTKPVPFSSPWRTISLDRVDDVSDQVLLAGKDGNFEISISLSTLGLAPQDGQSIGGDIGVLRGNGFQTVARLYWSNKATAITADVPSEAELLPRLWGKWTFAK
jgi:hypothetical protein